MVIYRVTSYIWRNTILKWYRDAKVCKNEKYWSEHELVNGREDTDKIFYVIRRRDIYCGLVSFLLTNLASIDIALKKGYIPVIDMQNNENIYLTTEKIGQENAWEYYFKQPMGYSLKDLKRSRHIIINSGAVPNMFPYNDISFLNGNTGELAYWQTLVKQYIHYSDAAKAQIEQTYHQLFTENDRILGVKCRGTDYVASKPKNHPIQPSIEQAIQKVREVFAEQKCTKIFLATEDAEIYYAFQKSFGDLVVSNKKEYVVYEGGSIGKQTKEQNDAGYLGGMEYLVTTAILAKCQCLVAGMTSGTVGAVLLSTGFEYSYFFDLGIYE